MQARAAGARWRCRLAVGLLGSVLAATVASWAQGGNAVVVGAEQVFVRRGPGTEFPPFATLTKGDTVEVQEMQGEWARIQTASGQTGYVRSNFLLPPGEKEKVSAPTPPAKANAPTPPAKVSAPPAPAAAPPAAAGTSPERGEAAALRAANERSKALEAEVRSLQQQLTELKSRAEATPAPVTPSATTTPGASPGGTERIEAQLARLTLALEEVQRRIDARPSSEPLGPAVAVTPDTSGHAWSSGSLALGALGLMIGWLLGGTLGRRQDRGRRARIRF